MSTTYARKANRSFGETVLVKGISTTLMFLIKRSLITDAQIERFVCHMGTKTKTKK